MKAEITTSITSQTTMFDATQEHTCFLIIETNEEKLKIQISQWAYLKIKKLESWNQQQQTTPNLSQEQN